jgi:RNA polymerase sigma-70 factor (ECF subfamily)
MAGSETTSDDSLYAAFRASGNERALEELVARHWEGSYRLALAVVRDPGAAEDAAQLAFVKVVAAAREGRSVESFGPYLRSAVVNEARMNLRSERRRSAHEERAALRRSELAEGERAVAIGELTASLPEKQRLPIELHYGLGLTHVEVGEALGCPSGTVSARIQDGLGALRKGMVAAALGVAAFEALLSESVRAGQGPVPAAPSARSLVARASAGDATPPSRAARLPALAAAGLVVVAGTLGVAALLSEPPASQGRAGPARGATGLAVGRGARSS